MRFLVVVDMQNDFINGALGTPEAQAIIDKVVQKINEFDGAVMYTQDTHYENYLDTQEGNLLPIKHCIENTDGWELHPLVAEAIKRKNEYNVPVKPFIKNAFGSVELVECLDDETIVGGVNEVVLVGLCTDICVISNAMLIKAYLPEVKITVDAFCCAGVTPESHENALKAMKMCQVNIENWEG